MASTAIDSPFVRRLAAAARAAWWTVVIGAILVTAQFIGYSLVLHSPCAWPWMVNATGLDDATLRLIAVRFMLAVRFVLVLWLLAAIFLSFWTRRLRRVGDA